MSRDDGSGSLILVPARRGHPHVPTTDQESTVKRTVHRLTVAAVAAGLLSIPLVAAANHIFADVDHGYVHAPGIEYVADNGITAGCGDGTNYCPNDPVTRGQMATFLHRKSGNAPGIDASVNAASIDRVEQVTNSNAIFGSALNTASVSCPAGTLATGGGSQTTSPTGWMQAFSRPLADGTGWTARFVQKDGFLGVNTTTVWALCVAAGTP